MGHSSGATGQRDRGEITKVDAHGVRYTPVECIKELKFGSHWLYGLLPCPCCGGEPRVDNCVTECIIFCNKCRLRISAKHAARKDTGIHEAIMAWQSRAKPPISTVLE